MMKLLFPLPAPRIGGALLAAVCAVVLLAGCHKTVTRRVKPATPLDSALASDPARARTVMRTQYPIFTPPPPVKTPAVDWFAGAVKNAQELVDYARTARPIPPEITVENKGATLKMVPVLITKNPTPTQMHVPLVPGSCKLSATLSLSKESKSSVKFYVNRMGTDHQRYRLKTVTLNPGDTLQFSHQVDCKEDGELMILGTDIDQAATTTDGTVVTLNNFSAVATIQR